jgi:RimJ/RimL family protein N-acetyltransferase
MKILETKRLTLRAISEADAELVLAVMNDPAFIQYVSDRGLRTREDAACYIRERILPGFDRDGFGMNVVELKTSQLPIGTCGLFKRQPTDDAELGFAYLREFWGQGFAYESAAALINHARDVMKLPRIVATTTPDNASSIKLLERLGFRLERSFFDEINNAELQLFGWSTANIQPLGQLNR